MPTRRKPSVLLSSAHLQSVSWNRFATEAGGSEQDTCKFKAVWRVRKVRGDRR